MTTQQINQFILAGVLAATLCLGACSRQIPGQVQVTGGTIEGAEAVAKSYPDFFSVIEDAGIRLSWAE